MSPEQNPLTHDWIVDPDTGVMKMLVGNAEVVQSQRAELQVNNYEWFLNEEYGYPWMLSAPDGSNAGILGTRMDKEFLSGMMIEKVAAYDGVLSVSKLDITYHAGGLEISISEVLNADSGDAQSVEIQESILKTLGGV